MDSSSVKQPSTFGHKVVHASFIDLSDYARPVAVSIASRLRKTRIHVYQITLFHFILMLIAAMLIAKGGFFAIVLASLLILLKNTFDAVDGSLARIRNRPSRVGRFLDSNLDFIGNLLLFFSLDSFPLWMRVLGFLSFLLQGSFFNFYYILFRNEHQGDTTSKVKENNTSDYPYDNQSVLTILYFFYHIFYKWQDQFVILVDTLVRNKSKIVPALFVTLLSVNGLGFQYLIVILLLLSQQQGLLFIWFIVIMNIYLLMLLIAIRLRK